MAADDPEVATSTGLAIERTFLAAERTLQAWVRTALSMISFGFTIVKFFQFLVEDRGGQLVGILGRQRSPAAVGLALVTIGTLALIGAIVQHRAALAELHRKGLAPRWSLALTVAVTVVLLGMFIFASLLLNK
jgi:putative membrane protein